MNGLTEAKGATSSAVFTTASVGTARLKGPTTVLPIFKICDRELAEIERRRQRYLGKRERVEIAGRTAIVIDDGIAAGATTRAAVRATRMRNPKQLVLAVPVAPRGPLVLPGAVGVAATTPGKRNTSTTHCFSAARLVSCLMLKEYLVVNAI